MFKGDIVRGKEGDAAAAGANGADASLEKLALFVQGGNGVWVEPWRGWGRGGGCWFESFVFLLGAGCEGLVLPVGYGLSPRWMSQASKCWANGIQWCRHAQRLQKDLKIQGDLENRLVKCYVRIKCVFYQTSIHQQMHIIRGSILPGLTVSYGYKFLFSHRISIKYLAPKTESTAHTDDVHISPKNGEQDYEWFAMVIGTLDEVL